MNWKRIALAACVLSFAAEANASTGITYDCDTAAGHFSELVLPAPGGPFSVTGNVQVNNIAQDKKWAPTVRLRIASAPASPGASPTAYGGFELSALPGKAVKMSPETVQVFSFDAAGHDEETIPSSLQAAGAVQPFRLSYDGSAVSVEVGGQSKSFPVAANPAVVQVICSTGEFLFTDLTIAPSH